MEIIALYGPDLQGKTPSKISDAKKNLLASFADEILLQINAHGSKNNHLELISGKGVKKIMSLPDVIKYLTRKLSLEQKKKIKIDVFTCHVGSNVQPTLKQSFESQTETVYEKELSTVLKNSGITLILNGGKYPTFGSKSARLIEESKGKEIEEILMARMLEPSTLKLAVNDGGENTQFIKFGAVKLKNIPADLSSEEKRKLIKDGLIQRINQMAEFLKTKNPEKAESIDKIKNNLIAEKLSETNYENFINKYLNDALIVEICKAERENIDQRIKNIKMLLEIGADVNQKSNVGALPLHIAVSGGFFQIVEILIANHSNFNHLDNTGSAPIYVAAQNGHLNVVQALIYAGADINLQTKSGTTPISIAAQNGHVNIVQALISAGANINKKDNSLTSPFYIAAQNGHLDVVRVLIDSGVNIDEPNSAGATPLYIAVQNGHLDVVKALTLAKAKIDQANNQGLSPIHMAVHKKNEILVKFLIDCGADISKENNDGITPLDIAAKMGYSEILEILIKSKLKQLENQQTNPEVLSSSNIFFENVKSLLGSDEIISEVKKALSEGLEKFEKLTVVSVSEISEPDDIISAQNDEANSSQPTDAPANNSAEAVHPKNTTQNQKRARVETAPSSDVERRTDREQKSLIRKLAGCFIPKSRE